jgi:hypothetical protein
LLNLRFQLATGQLDNYARVSETRRNVARVLMVLRDREIALAEGRDAGPVFLEQPLRPPRRHSEVADTVDGTDEDVHEIDDTLAETGESVGAEIDADDTEVDILAADDDEDEEDQ